MPKTSNQKLKALYILKILQEKTDDKHALSTQQIIEELDHKYEIEAERKSIYRDIKTLQEFGYEIVSSKSKELNGFYLAQREFELVELKLLVDAVQASRFMTVKKSRELISKLEKLASPYEAKQLQRQVYVSDRIKNSNESIYYIVDDIHRAMQENKRIRFQYAEWGVDGKMHCRRGGKEYEVSPFFLLWKDENYYLVAYDDEAGICKHYRVDKMMKLAVVEKERKGTQLAKTYNPATYVQQRFGMFSGETTMVTLQFKEDMTGVIFDRFGKDISIRKRDEEVYSARVEVAVSAQFFGWLTGVAPKVKLIAPQTVVQTYRKHLETILSGMDETLKKID